MRSLPWVVGVTLAIVYFAVFETLAFIHPTAYATLSYTIANLGHHWPLAIFIMGYFAGVLSAHLFWPWQENPLGKGGG